MKNLHIIHVKYSGPTNSRGSLVTIKSERFEQSISAPYDYAVGDVCRQAENMLKERGFNILGQGEGKNNHYIISDTFEPFKKK